MAADSSLTPHAVLLVHPTVAPYIQTIMNLQGQKNVTCESRPGPVISVSG